MPGICVDGSAQARDVLALQSVDVQALGKWCVSTEDYVLGCFQASEMTTELHPDEQVKGEDLIGELLKSVYGSRKAAKT